MPSKTGSIRFAACTASNRAGERIFRELTLYENDFTLCASGASVVDRLSATQLF